MLLPTGTGNKMLKKTNIQQNDSEKVTISNVYIMLCANVLKMLLKTSNLNKHLINSTGTLFVFNFKIIVPDQ